MILRLAGFFDISSVSSALSMSNTLSVCKAVEAALVLRNMVGVSTCGVGYESQWIREALRYGIQTLLDAMSCLTIR